MKRNDGAQVQVIEAIIVGILVFVAIAIAAVFRVPNIAGTFEQSELERLGTDVLLHLSAAVPRSGSDCNESGKCPFDSELERMVSLALRYEGATLSGTGERRDVSPLTDYFNQSMPDGARYVITYSNGVNATRIFPTTLAPPALDVVVAHALMAPNWTTFSAQARTSALIQIAELTGFTDASTNTIRDPLNRDKEEWGRTHKSLMSDASGGARVPVSAVYGTYQLCTAVPTCTYFTVVPPGVYGAGSSIALTDRDNSTTLVNRGALFTYLKFNDADTNDLLSTGERLYLDLDLNNVVSIGDLRMSDHVNCQGANTATCIAGTYVKTLSPAQTDIGTTIEAFPTSPLPRPTLRALAGDNDGVLEEGESLYLDVATALAPTGNGVVDANDRRFSRVATFRAGTQVAATDLDVARTLSTVAAHQFTAQTIFWGDTNLNGALNPEEPLYLDLEGNGQTAGLQSLDLRLSPRGTVNQRYVFDVQAVIWFGI